MTKQRDRDEAMHTTPWREYVEHGRTYRIRATYGWHKIGEQTPYWSVTAEQERHERGRWREDSAGCMHSEVARFFPHLVPTIKWHLSSQQSGPMHYTANARYWLEQVHGVSKWERRPYDPDPLEAFKQTVVFGAVPTDTAIPQLADLDQWCAARLPALIEAMQRDTGAVLGGQRGIVVPR